jgi:hypothetical protein
MELVLLLHIANYAERDNRFHSQSFESASDGSGVSVIDRGCIDKTNRSVCEHARLYYSAVSSDPPVFWQFDSAILPAGVQLVEEVSESGDDCHINIKGLTKRESKKFFKRLQKHSVLTFWICSDQGPRIASPTDLKAARDAFFQTRLP